MLTLERITNPNHSELERLIELYRMSFPTEERRTTNQLMEWIENKEDMYFCAIVDEKETVGLIVYWQFDSFLYLEHLAVFPEIRNRKIGEKTLDYLAENIPVPHLLEVEPLSDELTERRIGFYRRNGYEVIDKTYEQPPYPDRANKSISLWIMAKPLIEEGRVKEYIETIKREVYHHGY